MSDANDFLIAVSDELAKLLGKPFEIEYSRTHLVLKVRTEDGPFRFGKLLLEKQDLVYSTQGFDIIALFVFCSPSEKRWSVANPAFCLENIAEYLKSGIQS